MANFDIKSTGSTNIQTTFRYKIFFPSNGLLNIPTDIALYCQSATLPRATGEPIVWSLPMGMQNHQGGKRTIQPVQLEFVVPSNYRQSIYYMLETWLDSTYNIETGVNSGKGTYSVDGIKIQLVGEDDTVKHTFTLYRAFPTDADYGAVNSEGNETLKVSMTLVYDYYRYSG